MEYEKCYVFKPDDPQPAKRRRTEPQGLQSSWNLRKKAYQDTWKAQQDRIDERLRTINAATINNIVGFLEDVAVDAPKERIPTGLIIAGPNSALRTSIAAQISSQSNTDRRRSYTQISSSSGSNLKSLLKTIIQKVTSRTVEDDEDELEEQPASRKGGPKLLNYDLELLHLYVQERRIEQVVIAIEDPEACDGGLLSELVELFSYWQDRIPFVLLFNIATSVEFLQQRLSKTAIKHLDGRVFDAAVSADEVEQVFDSLTTPEASLWIGSNLATMILDRQSDYIQGIESLVQAARYAYMSHFYANAVSIFLSPSLELEDVTAQHLEAVRNLPSFRNLARQILDEGDSGRLRDLLDNDEELFDFAKARVQEGKQGLAKILEATEVVRCLQTTLPNATASSQPRMYVQAMSGKLAGSPMLRTLLLSLRKAPSDTAIGVVNYLLERNKPEDLTEQISPIATELEALIQNQDDTAQPLRSEEDVKNSTLRTTVIAQKVELSKQKSTLSKQDAAYTTIIRRLSDVLETYLTEKLVNPKDLAFHEIFMYDLKSPFREVFTPRPRHAVERALAAPHDYLDCDCCGPDQGEGDDVTLASSQPSTAVLYQLYLESGNLINASDLWQAFQAVVGDAQDEQQTMALFQRGLAEMRYLGFVKNTRKRVDHVAKVAWRGL
ncbi:hypothetical protein M409DRAFT_25374 [Zasmidium cellare ATCC 36951]|uniref:Uncharacterized protein n=1 Tax=Zasmidium cellare ATCC 36951 TaxID=1080233 RepID=A0A6A6CBB8_ZASCE|nr:uncharacterized protein M409DRAFT_25374 [Zasmidium cellare ATCC 36951]KAF2164497.1 hypothetical protein M409DRAFT_25374 [Zasmidium cellare ATCC 36951]